MYNFDFMKMTKILEEIDYKRYIFVEILPVPNSYVAPKQSTDSIKIKLYLNK